MAQYSKNQWLILILFGIAQFCNALCFSIQAPFYPKIAEDKGAVPSQYGFVFGVYELVVFLLCPVYGKYLNEIGAKLVNNTGIFTVSVACILFGFLEKVNGTTVFIVLSFAIRIIEATGAAAFTTAAFSIIAKEFPNSIGATFAMLETVFGIGLILGPTIGGALYELGGFMLPFCTIGSLLVCAAILILILLPDEGGDPSLHATHGLFDLLRLTPVLLGAVTIFGASFSIGFVQATLEPHLRPLNLTPLQLGLMFVLNGASYALSAPIWGRLCDRGLSPQSACAAGAIIICLAFLLIGPAPYLPFHMSLPLSIVALLVHGVGMAAELVAGFSGFHRDAIGSGLFDEGISTYGLVSGLWTSSFALGAFIGPSLGGVLYDAIGFPWASQVVVGLHFLLFLLTVAYIVHSRKKGRSTPGGYTTLKEAEIAEQQPIIATENGFHHPNSYGSSHSR